MSETLYFPLPLRKPNQLQITNYQLPITSYQLIFFGILSIFMWYNSTIICDEDKSEVLGNINIVKLLQLSEVVN
ncbi:MAG: hypothetical protein WBF90_37815 [Rivularia sp. (in: cyanobacteria)]